MPPTRTSTSTGINNKECHICQKVFTRAHDVTRHMKIHESTREWKCTEPGCSFSSHQPSSLNRHMNTHTGAKPYACTYCSIAYGDSATLFRHVRRVHKPDSLYRCPVKGCISAVSTVERAVAHLVKKHNIVKSQEELDMEKWFNSSSLAWQLLSPPSTLASTPASTTAPSPPSFSLSPSSLFDVPTTPCRTSAPALPPLEFLAHQGGMHVPQQPQYSSEDFGYSYPELFDSAYVPQLQVVDWDQEIAQSLHDLTTNANTFFPIADTPSGVFDWLDASTSASGSLDAPIPAVEWDPTTGTIDSTLSSLASRDFTWSPWTQDNSFL